MRSFAALAAAAVASGAAFVACTPPAVAPTNPPRMNRFTVHIDTLAPEKAAQFETARRDWVAVLRAHRATDLRGRFYEVRGVGFMTFRPLGSFGELDRRGSERKQALAAVPADKLAAYDRDSDSALAFPHASEIWEIDDDLAYAPPIGALDLATAGHIRMIVEETKPDTASEQAYQNAWNAAKQALVDARYPLTRVTLRSVFGAGRIVTCWLARSADELAAAPAVEAVIAQRLGEPRASELAAAREATVLRSEVRDVIPRPDLASP